jgi:hypothetical protein
MTTVLEDRAGEIARYLDAVREALRDLPPQQRDELLEDLPEHLAEVAAEEPAPLADQLGQPEAYAAELRATIGPAGNRRRLRDRLRLRWAPALAALGRLDRRLGPMIGYARLSDFGRLLVPAWWVLRGYIAAMVVVAVLDQGRSSLGMLPRLGGSTLAGLVILAGFVIGSIWLARRTSGLSRRVRRGVHLASTALVIVGLAGLAGMDAILRWLPDYSYNETYYDPYGDVSDVYVFDRDGNLVRDATLRDQNGTPVELGSVWCFDDSEAAHTYPRCPDPLPWWIPESAIQPDADSPEPSRDQTGPPSAGPNVEG